MIWKIHSHSHNLSRRGWIMGVLNVTPDSFSDGGRFADHEQALDHARQMIAEGADMIDIGGESSRPGAVAISVEEELTRVLPLIAALRTESDVLISIDTCKPEVAHAALKAGADIVNDIGGLRLPAMREVIAATEAGAISMHMRGTPAEMQRAPEYADVVAEVRDFFDARLADCVRDGIEADRIVFDPGIGFGKTVAHNLALLRNLGLLRPADRPMLIGVSRKSFISKITGDEGLEQRFWPTVALTAYCREAGAEIIRVHDVLPNAQALSMTEAIHG